MQMHLSGNPGSESIWGIERDACLNNIGTRTRWSLRGTYMRNACNHHNNRQCTAETIRKAFKTKANPHPKLSHGIKIRH